LPVPGGPIQEDIFASCDEAPGGELEEQGAIHFLVEGEIEGVERARRIAETRLQAAACKEAILPALQFITDEHRDQVERREPFRLCMAEPCVEDIRHAGEAQRAERALEFNEIHVVAARRSIRSR
jgi:hypothetical protein